ALPVMTSAIVPVSPELTDTTPSAAPKASVLVPAVPGLIAASDEENNTAPLVSVTVMVLLIDRSLPAIERQLTLNVLVAVEFELMRMLLPAVNVLRVNSSVGFKGRSPVVAL